MVVVVVTEEVVVRVWAKLAVWIMMTVLLVKNILV